MSKQLQVLQLEAIVRRLITGLDNADFDNCEWYDGILEDAEAEARKYFGKESET